MPIVAEPNRKTKIERPGIQPPKDPVLRAIYRVGQCDDLTNSERLALLAIWRYMGGKRKQIGPSLLAGIIGTSREQAKHLLKGLQAKGYIGSTGKRGAVTRVTATRWIKRKARLPKPTKRGVVATRNKVPGRGARATRDEVDGQGERGAQTTRGQELSRGAGTPVSRGARTPTDLGVRQGGTDPAGSLEGPQAQTAECANSEPLTPIADLLQTGGTA